METISVPYAADLTSKNNETKVILPGQIWLGWGQQPTFPDRVYPGIILNTILTPAAHNNEGFDLVRLNNEANSIIMYDNKINEFSGTTDYSTRVPIFACENINAELLDYDPFVPEPVNNQTTNNSEATTSASKTNTPLRFVLDPGIAQFRRVYLKFKTNSPVAKAKYKSFKMFACKSLVRPDTNNLTTSNKWRLHPDIKVVQCQLDGEQEEILAELTRPTKYNMLHARPENIPADTSVVVFTPIDPLIRTISNDAYKFGFTNAELREVYDCFFIEVELNPHITVEDVTIIVTFIHTSGMINTMSEKDIKKNITTTDTFV